MNFETLAAEVIGDSVKLYALMTPPAVLSAFVSHTRKLDAKIKRRIALKTSCAIFILGALLYIFGQGLFDIFGFTLDAFRIGSGALLLLTAIDLMKDNGQENDLEMEGDISIVPLAVPLGMGPASIGAVMVMGAAAENSHTMLAGVCSLFIAASGMYALLRLGDMAGRVLGATGIAVLAKLTGLLLAAIAAQVIFTGVAGFL